MNITRLMVSAVIGALPLAGCAAVGTGQRGVVLNQHHPTGEIKPEGFYFYNLLTDTIVEMDVMSQTQTIDISAGTADNQHVDTKVSVNYSVDPSKVSSIYDQTLGDFTDKWIFPSIHASMTNEIGRLHAPDLNMKRSDIQNKVEHDLKKLLTPRGVLISQVLITSDFRFTDQAYADSISRLAAAKNDVLTAKQEAQAKYERSIGERKAQEQAITPLTLQKKFLDKWDGHLPHTLAGGLPFLGSADGSGAQPVTASAVPPPTMQGVPPARQQQRQRRRPTHDEPANGTRDTSRLHDPRRWHAADDLLGPRARARCSRGGDRRHRARSDRGRARSVSANASRDPRSRPRAGDLRQRNRRPLHTVEQIEGVIPKIHLR